MKLAALILAAGASRRLGRPKQLEPVDGIPLVRRTAGLALESGFDPVLVVVGHEAARVISALGNLPVQSHFNPGWEQGMATSILRGLEAIPPEVDGALILLVDHVALTVQILEALKQAFLRSPGRPAASGYGEVKGVPAIFPRSWFEALSQLEGDQGARMLLRSAPVTVVPWSDGQVDLDSDSVQP